MRTENKQRLHAYWRDFFAVDPAELSRDAVLVRAQPPGFAGYDGAYLVRRDEGIVLFAPDAWIAHAGDATRRRDPASLFRSEGVTSIFGDAVEQVIGRAVIAYADDTDFTPADVRGARLLTQDDAPALDHLRDACPPLDWQHAGAMHIVQHPTFALFAGGEIVAAASCDFQGDFIRHVGVITHPAHRGHGYATAVASALTAHGVGEGAIMQWQTLAENLPSLRIGQRLGYKPVYETMAVRLRPAARP